MAQSSASLHEPPDVLAPATVDRHRAIASLMEELEAVDWYDQRIDAAGDPELAATLAHNRDEEKEHAAMALEWLRRHDPVWDTHLRRFLFTEDPITDLAEAAEIEEAAEQAEGGEAAGVVAGIERSGSLAIGALRDKEHL